MTQDISLTASKQICRTCKEEKCLSQFSVGQAGRRKTICNDCVRAIITVYYGSGGLRRCTTCGRLTIDYRCARCWRKIRGFDLDVGVDCEII